MFPWHSLDRVLGESTVLSDSERFLSFFSGEFTLLFSVATKFRPLNNYEAEIVRAIF